MIRDICLLAGLIVVTLCCAQLASDDAVNAKPPNPYTLAGPRHLINDVAPRGKDGTLNAVVEIPAGTNAKWEVDAEDGQLKWEFKKGKPRVVRYLPYPANYGMIPGTILPTEMGGDGDPLDVLVLAPAIKRGQVASIQVIGVLKMRDEGEQDDKLIAVVAGSPLGDVASLSEMREEFPGVLEILELWMTNYKGRDKMKSLGYGDRDEAEKIVQLAISAFKKQAAAER